MIDLLRIIDLIGDATGACGACCKHGGACVLAAKHKGLHDASGACFWSDEESVSREEGYAILKKNLAQREKNARNS